MFLFCLTRLNHDNSDLLPIFEKQNNFFCLIRLDHDKDSFVFRSSRPEMLKGLEEESNAVVGNSQKEEKQSKNENLQPGKEIGFKLALIIKVFKLCVTTSCCNILFYVIRWQFVTFWLIVILKTLKILSDTNYCIFYRLKINILKQILFSFCYFLYPISKLSSNNLGNWKKLNCHFNFF